MKKFDIPDNEALRFVSSLKAGWNLGNTFDAYDDGNTSLGLKLETYWCGAKTTPELFRALKKAGFNLVRIPVSWHNHLIDSDYTVDPAWMARVKEVAQYAADEGLYFIINIHHDNQEKYFYPDSAHYEQTEKYLTAIWKQMAEAFADFDEHCILESMNEPRLVGTKYEWSWSNAVSDCRLSAKYINQLNQKFVDIVRGSGGNNATRYLAVPAYCASPWNAADQAFQLPEDIADNRIIVAAHAYTPYNFALNLQSKDRTFDIEKDQNKKGEIASFMNALYNRFIKNGIPVMMDEFGALDKDGNLQDRVNFTSYYVASASARGITCVWWDNHGFTGDGERFGLIRRNTLEWVYPDIALAIQANCLYNR